MKKSVLFSCVLVAALVTTAVADEGMWLFNRFPSQKLKQKHGWTPSQQWLDHLRLSSVRMGASASFVSPDGLVFTNHHVGAGCVHDISTADHDYMKEGFYAGAREKEPKCPGLQVSYLTEIRDITKDVHNAAKPGMTEAQAGAAQRELMSKLEKDCSDAAQNFRCETVTLYSGGMYNLYRYKVYRDIRLVMAPEFDIAFFGGDPDNFTYPRYDLDITFFRVYENDKPIKVDNYLPFTTKGVKEGDLIFISGHPGSTGRLLTMVQLEYLRDVAYPARLKTLKQGIELLKKFGETSPENARAAERILFSYQNSYKALSGYQSGLLDKSIMAKKAADEQKLRAAVAKDPKLKESAGAWDAITGAVTFQRDNFKQISYVENPLGGRLAGYARMLVRVAEEKQKPSDQRLRGFQDQQIPAIQAQVLSTAPINKDLEVVQLTQSLTDAAENLGASDPFVQKLLAGKTPADRAKQLIGGTKLEDVSFRKELWEGGAAAVNATNDPLIEVVKAIDPESRAIRKQVEDKVDAVVRRNGGLIAKARFAIYGDAVAPDATGTLRLSYGVVKGYTEGGKKIPYSTTMSGAYELSQKHDNKPPYELPKSWLAAKDKVNLNTPFDTVNTGDSIGGNSGSPVVNKDGEIVGILFDGNIQSLPWNFFFDDVDGRTVLTDSRAVIESLQRIYKAQPLADELLNAGKPAAAAATAKK